MLTTFSKTCTLWIHGKISPFTLNYSSASKIFSKINRNLLHLSYLDVEKMVNFQFITILCTCIYTLSLLKLALGQDTMYQNQTLTDGQTLISPDQMFKFGFFSPGTSKNRFVGIWYTNTPEIVIWVANRNNPITNSTESSVSITINGILGINGGGNVIWSSNSTGVASNPVLQLLNSGNLVIVKETSEVSNPIYLWQSFDYPTDTRVQGVKIADNPGTDHDKYLTSWKSPDDPSSGDYAYRLVNNGLGQMIIFNGTSISCRGGIYNGQHFNGLPSFPTPGYQPILVFDQDKLVSISEPINTSFITRVTLDSSGVVQRFTMNEKRNQWNLLYSSPRDRCDSYALCGPYGVCKNDESPICDCLKGFLPKNQKDWDYQDWSRGCKRTTNLDCGSDGFVKLEGVKFPDMLDFWLNTSKSTGLDECREKCLRNCSCTAYANPFITNGGSGCLMWFGELVDMREISGAINDQDIYVRMPFSELGSDSESKKKRIPPKLIISLIALGVFLCALICGIILLMRRQRKPAEEVKNDELELPLFEYATIAAATSNFSRDNIIGEGGFGPVYKGHLSSSGEIAVKRLSKNSGQGLEQFKNEVILIAKLQHRDLVRLLGCCIQGEERMLIYEYMENKSLDYFVFDEKRTVLTWPKRFNIIMGISRGLLYLHQDSRLKIVHRDLKTSNILLDGNLNPKISDFGLARILGGDQTIETTKRVFGTYGYMAPEYAIDGKFSVKSDIYSIGVVMLEIVSGKKNRGFKHGEHYHSLLGHAWLLWKENRAIDVMDECLSYSFVESQVKKCIQVGLLCVQKFEDDRPIMSNVLFMLGSEGAILPEPKEPGFFAERSCEKEETCTSTIESGRNTITMTALEAR